MGERRAIAGLLAAAILLAGCAGQSRRAVATGFLADAELTADAADANALAYWSPALDLREYDSVIVAPVEAALRERQRTQAPTPQELDALAQGLADALAEGLGARWRIATAPGARTLLLRAVITDVRASAPALNIHPATKLIGVGLGGASVEAELVDSVSGARLAAFADTRLASKEIGSGLTRWGDARSALESWTELLAQRLEGRRGGGEDGRR